MQPFMPLFKIEVVLNTLNIERSAGTVSYTHLESMLEGMSEYYSKNLSREVRKGMKENALKCQFTGGRPPYGLKVDEATRRLVVNEEEAPAIRFIFDSVKNGLGYNLSLIHI